MAASSSFSCAHCRYSSAGIRKRDALVTRGWSQTSWRSMYAGRWKLALVGRASTAVS